MHLFRLSNGLIQCVACKKKACIFFAGFDIEIYIEIIYIFKVFLVIMIKKGNDLLL